MKTLKKAIARLMVLALTLQMIAGPAHAVKDISTGVVDFGGLADVVPTLDEANTILMSWRRTGSVTNQPPVAAAAMTFEWLRRTPPIPLPTRALCGDNTCNNNNSLWSDNVIRVNYTRGNSLSTVITLNTFNIDLMSSYTGTPPVWNRNADPSKCNGGTDDDPRCFVGLRGGLAGIGETGTDPVRASILPMAWKAAALEDILAASGAHIGGPAVPSNSPFVMFGQVEATSGGACPAGEPGAGGSRGGPGYCDFASHFFLDPNNYIRIPTYCLDGRWYTDYDPARGGPCNDATRKKAAFDYATLVNGFGVATTENATGLGAMNPAYVILGADITNALRTRYSTIVQVAPNTF